ncbi:hypothetical protein BASA81_002651 [Batrachochytrium salamandrivorans]|nr:hypothetical protein BASA81_002651 [Batrachochytrium salamandrivorans]
MTKHNQYVEVLTQAFLGFSGSRNSLLKLASNPSNNKTGSLYDWSLMIDDSYHLVGSLRQSLTPQLSKKVYSVKIGNPHNSSDYTSARVFRTKYITGIKYIGDIHEVLNHPSQGLLTGFKLVDVPCESHVQRTFQRNTTDLECLASRNDPSSTYYAAMTKYNMFKNGSGNIKEVFNALLVRAKMDGDHEEKMFTLVALGGICEELNLRWRGVEFYKLAAEAFPPRKAECYFYAYMLGGDIANLKIAYENRVLNSNALFRFPFCNDLYGEGHISKAWNRAMKELSAIVKSQGERITLLES